MKYQIMYQTLGKDFINYTVFISKFKRSESCTANANFFKHQKRKEKKNSLFIKSSNNRALFGLVNNFCKYLTI